MQISTICVCGAGTMGSGIAQACAQAGFYTLLYELNDTVLEKARTGIEKNLDSLLQKGKINKEEKKKYFSALSSQMISKPAWRMFLLKP
jgi:3-hydroxybutyryl-CoA dehydrogenase